MTWKQVCSILCGKGSVGPAALHDLHYDNGSAAPEDGSESLILSQGCM